MEQLNFNSILERENLANEIKDILTNFEANKKNLSIKRGIYIYGAPGSGKTQFIYKLLEDLNYDIISYDAGDVRNKSIIDTITQSNMTDMNVLSLLKQKRKPLVIVMDEIDGMNNGDKGGINSLIKVIRPKKTRKQKLEEVAYIPIICIGNYHIDKKINELIKVCHTFTFSSPTDIQINNIIKSTMPKLSNDNILCNNVGKFVAIIFEIAFAIRIGSNELRAFFNVLCNLALGLISVYINPCICWFTSNSTPLAREILSNTVKTILIFIY